MNILVVQESDWILRGPHQQHHLFEQLSIKGHKIKVIDYEILYKQKGIKEIISKRKEFLNISKYYSEAKIDVVRPSIIKLPVLDKLSIIYTHRNEIWKQINEFKPDIMVGFGILNTYLAMKIAQKNKIPFIYYLIDALHQLLEFYPYKILAQQFEKNILKNANTNIVINNKLKEYAIEMGAKKENVIIIPAGVNIKNFHIERNNQIRNEFNIKYDEILLFYMGWIYEFSGLTELAKIIVKNKKHGIKLLILGIGDKYDELLELSKIDDNDKYIIMPGWQPYDQIPNYIAASDICILPAVNNKIMENIVPIKIYEYMASGKPVISTKLKGIQSEFGLNNGIIYADNPYDVYKKAYFLSQNRNDIIELGQKTRKYVENQDWNLIVNKFEEILDELLSKDSNPCTRGTISCL